MVISVFLDKKRCSILPEHHQKGILSSITLNTNVLFRRLEIQKFYPMYKNPKRTQWIAEICHYKFNLPIS